MNSIFWSFAAAALSFIVAAVLCSRLVMPENTLPVLITTVVSLYMAFITLLLCAGLSYILIVLIKPPTPMQFRYRPAPYFLFRKGSARSRHR
jgi:ABC-type polysaccharide/polyol phosphate export permease